MSAFQGNVSHFHVVEDCLQMGSCFHICRTEIQWLILFDQASNKQVYGQQEKTQLALDENSDSIHVFCKPHTSYVEEILQLPYTICTMYAPQCGTQDVPNSRLDTHYNLHQRISHDPGSCTQRNLHGMDCTGS